MRHFDEVMADVSKYVPQELFTELYDVIVKEIEDACEAESYDKEIKDSRI